MEIILCEINTSQPVAAPKGKGVGYWGYFHSELTDGEAAFILSAGDPTLLLWKELEVWVSQEAIVDFQVLPPGQHAVQLSPLALPGDYQATGMVTSILWFDDEDWEHAVIDVMVGPCKFSFLAQEIGAEMDLEYGQWVSFGVKRLTFWDMGALP